MNSRKRQLIIGSICLALAVLLLKSAFDFGGMQFGRLHPEDEIKVNGKSVSGKVYRTPDGFYVYIPGVTASWVRPHVHENHACFVDPACLTDIGGTLYSTFSYRDFWGQTKGW